jgi:hypothetical protein
MPKLGGSGMPSATGMMMGRARSMYGEPFGSNRTRNPRSSKVEGMAVCTPRYPGATRATSNTP